MAFGDIGSVIDTLEFDIQKADWCRLVKVNATIALIFYGDTNGDQKVVSVEVDAAGQITNTVKDSLIWNGGWCSYNAICKRDGDIYVCVYRGANIAASVYGNISTVNCSPAGAIPASTEDDQTFDASSILWSSVLYLAGNVVVVAFKDELNNGVLKTFMVSAAGVITTPPEDTFEFEANQGTQPHLCKISDSKIAVVYSDADSDGQLFTIGIDSAGNIDAGKIDTFEFETVGCYYPRICHVSGDIYAIVFHDNDKDGWLKTVEITSAGAITEPVKDSYEFDAGEGNEPSLYKLSDSVVAVCYYDVSNHGQLFTIGISAAGLIDAGKIDTLQYEAAAAYYNDIIHMDGDIYLIVYRGTDSDGFCKSVDISTPVVTSGHHEMIMKIGP